MESGKLVAPRKPPFDWVARVKIFGCKFEIFSYPVDCCMLSALITLCETFFLGKGRSGNVSRLSRFSTRIGILSIVLIILLLERDFCIVEL
jgi:hypothetical protein